ncbi:polysaccharide biosynthesis/export family protein [Sphingobium boeckii]|uniref:Polysaccharide export outer membrane protein n=1 Tax=Sphingobium boeckii TaxID=1082345 RepID=A0A7W9EFI8_9SPHN|nr:polysaccharide biosynthesis/export family protein [Sphingobium boeckii]MBB5685746.1 polysaccharide export outer membrane protein [Sphingobium boeckii]
MVLECVSIGPEMTEIMQDRNVRQAVIKPYRMGAFALALVLCTSGCSSGLKIDRLGGPSVTRIDANELPGPDGQVGDQQIYKYVIGPLDKLVIDVFGFEQISDRRVTVDGTGNIVLPMAGVIHVGGLSLGDASALIASQMRENYVRDPQVAVNLEEALSNYVTVDGEVKQPGNYPVVAGLTLMRSVAGAKGTTDFAQLREVVVHRTVNGRQMIALYDLAAIRRGAYADPIIYPRDVVVVGDSPGRRLFQQIIAVSPLFISPLIAVLDNR